MSGTANTTTSSNWCWTSSCTCRTLSRPGRSTALVQWYIWNETTAGENFAEKWNRRPERAQAFYAWHGRLCADIAELPTVRGIDRLGAKLKGLFGQKPANDAIGGIVERVSDARTAGKLRVAPKVRPHGTAACCRAASTPVRSNTFFGSEEVATVAVRRPQTAHRGAAVSESPGEPRSVRATANCAPAADMEIRGDAFALSRDYGVRIEFVQDGVPETYVDAPDLQALAGDRKIPHLYSQRPPKLCLYLPKTYEWQPMDEARSDGRALVGACGSSTSRIGSSDDWKGGGMHPGEDNVRRREAA